MRKKQGGALGLGAFGEALQPGTRPLTRAGVCSSYTKALGSLNSFLNPWHLNKDILQAKPLCWLYRGGFRMSPQLSLAIPVTPLQSFLWAGWGQLSKLILPYFVFKRLYLFLDKGEGKGKERERNISVWLPFARFFACT